MFVRRAEYPAPAPLYARFAKWAKAPEVAKGGSASAGKGEGSVEEGEEEGALVRVVPAPTGSPAPSTHERHGKGCRGERQAGMLRFGLPPPPPLLSLRLLVAAVAIRGHVQFVVAQAFCVCLEVGEGYVCE